MRSKARCSPSACEFSFAGPTSEGDSDLAGQCKPVHLGLQQVPTGKVGLPSVQLALEGKPQPSPQTHVQTQHRLEGDVLRDLYIRIEQAQLGEGFKVEGLVQDTPNADGRQEPGGEEDSVPAI